MVYHLNIGQPDIHTPDVVIKKLNSIDLKVIEYSKSEGMESYRLALSDYYNSKGIYVNSEDIMITTGGSEALLFAMQSCFNPGDSIIIPEPYYANYNGFAMMSGVTVTPASSIIDDGFALPPIEDFEQLITPKTKGILVCNPGNPTGYLYSDKELEALRRLALKHDLYLIADEVYREFCYDGAKPKSVLNLEGLEENVIMIDSVSKRYSMCGARIGALVSRNEEVMETALKFAQARLSPPTLGQIVGEAALETPQSYFDKVTAEYVERRDILVDGLNEIPGVKCPKPKGAFYCMAELPVKDSEDFCQWMLEHFDHDGKTVMMAPASGFYASTVLGKQEVRLAYVLEKELLKDAVNILAEGLKVYPGRL